MWSAKGLTKYCTPTLFEWIYVLCNCASFVPHCSGTSCIQLRTKFIIIVGRKTYLYRWLTVRLSEISVKERPRRTNHESVVNALFIKRNENENSFKSNKKYASPFILSTLIFLLNAIESSSRHVVTPLITLLYFRLSNYSKYRKI